MPDVGTTTGSGFLGGMVSGTQTVPDAASASYRFETATSTQQEEAFSKEMAVPRLVEGGDAAFRATVNAAIDAAVAGLQKDFDQGLAEEKGQPVGPGPWSFDLSGQVERADAALISVILDASQYTGGAHPNSTYAVVQIDPKTAKVLSWSDVLLPDALATLAAAAEPMVLEKYKQDDLEPDLKWVKEGTAPKAENYALTHLSDEGLVIFFPSYQVAPYVYGPQRFVIPYVKLGDLVKPEYLK